MFSFLWGQSPPVAPQDTVPQDGIDQSDMTEEEWLRAGAEVLRAQYAAFEAFAQQIQAESRVQAEQLAEARAEVGRLRGVVRELVRDAKRQKGEMQWDNLSQLSSGVESLDDEDEDEEEKDEVDRDAGKESDVEMASVRLFSPPDHRVHWACASFEDGDAEHLDDEPWYCPDCEFDVHDIDREAPVVQLAQRERCIRPDCIMRTRERHKGTAHGDNFVFERIIGRKTVDRNAKYERVYAYLIKWEDYPIYDCTWERGTYIQSLDRHLETFKRECKRHDINMQSRIALLPEASSCWNDDGLRMRQALVDQGVVPAEWWEGDDESEA